jgi:hypothetical protein
MCGKGQMEGRGPSWFHMEMRGAGIDELAIARDRAMLAKPAYLNVPFLLRLLAHGLGSFAI